MKRTIASVLIAIMSILCIGGGGYSESDALNGGIEAEEIILDQLPEPEQESEEDMATGDKLVNLDDLKVAYDKQQEDTNSLKSALNVTREISKLVTSSEIEQGGYDGSGYPTSLTTRIRTKKFAIYAGETVSIKPGTVCTYSSVGFFTEVGSYTSYDWSKKERNITAENNGYVVVIFRKTSGTDNVSPSDYDATVKINTKTEKISDGMKVTEDSIDGFTTNGEYSVSYLDRYAIEQGAISGDGNKVNPAASNRIRTSKAVKLPFGTVITAKAGYQFNVLLYSGETENSTNFISSPGTYMTEYTLLSESFVGIAIKDENNGDISIEDVYLSTLIDITGKKKIVKNERNYLHLSFDDVEYCFGNIANHIGTYTSIFDDPFFAALKDCHVKYGARFSLYCYDISSAVTTIGKKYADDFNNASEWLKFGCHLNTVNDYNTFISNIMALGMTIDSVDRIPRLDGFQGTYAEIMAMKDADCGIVGLLSADDSRSSYYLNSEQNEYLQKNSKLVDYYNGLTFFSTNMRLDWFYNGFSSQYTYNVPVKSNPYEELVYRLSKKETAKLYEPIIVFVHEWRVYSQSGVLDSSFDLVRQVCKFGKIYGFDFDYPYIRENFGASSLELSEYKSFKERRLVVENGSFYGDGTDAPSTTKVRLTENIYDNAVIIDVPDNVGCTVNIYLHNDTQRRSVDSHNPVYINDVNGYIRVAFYTLSGDSIQSTWNTYKDNIHIYTSKNRKSADYDIVIAASDSAKMDKEKADFVLNGTNDTNIIQAIFGSVYSAKCLLMSGTYNITKVHPTTYDKDSAFSTFELTIPSEKRQIELIGNIMVDNLPKSMTSFVVSSSLYDSITDETALFLVPRTGQSESTVATNRTTIAIKNIQVMGQGYGKPIVFMDFTVADSCFIDRCLLSTLQDRSSFPDFESVPNSLLTAIRVGHGSNDGTNNHVKNVRVMYFHTGISCNGEHFIFEDVLAHHCYVGFAFGDRMTRPGYEHPNIMIGCSIEGSKRLMTLSKYGETTEQTATEAENTLVCIGLSTESLFHDPETDEDTLTLPILEIIKGLYRGRIEADYYANSPFAEGSGENMKYLVYNSTGYHEG